ncbi:MAG: hypothetical protein QY314_02395 [Candidatus Dojkabacteria bacterium]|nr:MAG: hypothetical protein QY314_02395 [Candidatus Dojkabacteria bacterium]
MQIPQEVLDIRDVLVGESDYGMSDIPEDFSLATHVQDEMQGMFEHIAFTQEDVALFREFREHFPQVSDMIRVIGWRVFLEDKSYVIFIDQRTNNYVGYAYLLNTDTFEWILSEFKNL